MSHRVSPSPSTNLPEESRNDADMATDAKWTLARLLDRHVHERPSAIAVWDGERSATWLALQSTSQRFTKLLLQRGVTHGSRVAVLANKDLETLIATLAVFRLGAVYVPIDPNLPHRRVNFLLEDAAPTLVLGREKLRCLAGDRPFFSFDDCATWAQEDDVGSEPLPECDARTDDVAYTCTPLARVASPKE
jgi:acyl-CoA synthetase (AMP-forming)/AMP-acid ligase II